MPCYILVMPLSAAVIDPDMFHGKAVWKILGRKGVLEKAAYLMPIRTAPIHTCNFKGSEKFCNAETCWTLLAPEFSKPLTLGHFLLLFLFFKIFIYFRLCWVLVAGWTFLRLRREAAPL